MHMSYNGSRNLKDPPTNGRQIRVEVISKLLTVFGLTSFLGWDSFLTDNLYCLAKNFMFLQCLSI